MKVYYLQSEYQPGKRRIVRVLYDDGVFKQDEETLSPFFIFTIDEVDPVNKAICMDLWRTAGKVDANGFNKYHVDIATGNLMEQEAWVERVEDI